MGRLLCMIVHTLVILLLSLCPLASSSCESRAVPSLAEPVSRLDLPRYMGTWYEIARLPNYFEDGLSHVKAQYTLLDNGSVYVLNTGVDDDGDVSQAKGRAFRPEGNAQGHLLVSFVPPYCWFYGSYNVIYIDSQYRYAIVAGSSPDLLWFLARDSHIDEEQREFMLTLAETWGYDVSRLIWTEQGDAEGR